MATNNAAKQSHALVWLSRITQGGSPIQFSAMTGGTKSSEASQEFDGGSEDPEVTTSPATTEDITVTLRFKPGRDAKMLKNLRAQVGTYTDTMTVLYTDPNRKPLPGVEPIVFSEAVLRSASLPAFDRNSTETATIDLVFAVTKEA